MKCRRIAQTNTQMKPTSTTRRIMRKRIRKVIVDLLADGSAIKHFAAHGRLVLVVVAGRVVGQDQTVAARADRPGLFVQRAVECSGTERSKGTTVDHVGGLELISLILGDERANVDFPESFADVKPLPMWWHHAVFQRDRAAAV